MIGTHNTMTYLPPRRWWFRPFTFLWRCQTKSLSEQVGTGAGYFDIRIRKTKNGGFRFAHGLVDLGDIEFSDPKEIFEYLDFYGQPYRVLVEKGDFSWITGDLMLWIEESTKCVYLGIKKPWTSLWSRLGFNKPIKDYSYVPVYTGDKPEGSRFNLSTIKRWAKKHNPPITPELIQDEVIHFMDLI